MKKAIVIGASSGIGQEVTKLLIAEGYRVGIAARRLSFLNEFKENFFDVGGCDKVDDGLYNYPFNTNLFPMSFSLKATVASE